MEVKVLRVRDLKPGMVVASDIYGKNGKLIFGEGVVLTDQTIYRLEMYGIFEAKIFIPDGEAIDTQEPIEDKELFANKIKKTPQFKVLSSQQTNATKMLQNVMEGVISDPEMGIDADMMAESVRILSRSYKNLGGSVISLIQSMRDKDDETFDHSMNVSLLCAAFADWLYLSDSDKQVLILAGLYHDIGKLCLSKALLTKKEKLTEIEFDILKSHTDEGYAILGGLDIDNRIKEVALSHHERIDGSGYPFGVTGEFLPYFSKIVSICDTYEAMTAPRAYRPALCPFTVVDVFLNDGYQKFDTKLMMTFCENVIQTHINMKVRLSDGQKGTVVRMNSGDITKPLIKIGDTFLDLSKNRNVSVEAIIA